MGRFCNRLNVAIQRGAEYAATPRVDRSQRFAIANFARTNMAPPMIIATSCITIAGAPIELIASLRNHMFNV